MQKSFPKISIITIVWNNVKHIEFTIQSVIEQTYPNIEYIIIDGGSTDGTLDVVKKYESKISTLVSEKDKGLYDAMNKGLQQATGDYVWFINSGDAVFNSDCLLDVFNQQPNADCYFGDCMLIDTAYKEVGLRSIETRKKLPVKLSYQSLKYGMNISHQSFIVKRKLAPLYNLQRKHVADIDWMIGCLKNIKTYECYKGVALSRFMLDGYSTKHRNASLRQRFDVMKQHYGLLPTVFNHGIIFFKIIGFQLNKLLR